jgi:hypothetical protein
MNRIVRLWVVLVSVGLAAPAFADGGASPDRDTAAIRHVIAGQIQAFEKNDGATAFRLSSPKLRARFQSAGSFMRMVQKNYAPVFRPTLVSFAGLDDLGNDTKVQHVLVVGDDGNTHEALYVMEHQKSGAWLVAGCFLVESELVAS